MAAPEGGGIATGVGERHGFDATIGVGAGTHTIYVYAIDTDETDNNNPLIGTTTVTIT